MSMHFVSSTLVDSIGYHNGNLYIQFKNGNLYEYFNVPFRHYQGMLAAKDVYKRQVEESRKKVQSNSEEMASKAKTKADETIDRLKHRLTRPPMQPRIRQMRPPTNSRTSKPIKPFEPIF